MKLLNGSPDFENPWKCLKCPGKVLEFFLSLGMPGMGTLYDVWSLVMLGEKPLYGINLWNVYILYTIAIQFLFQNQASNIFWCTVYPFSIIVHIKTLRSIRSSCRASAQASASQSFYYMVSYHCGFPTHPAKICDFQIENPRCANAVLGKTIFKKGC